MLLKRGSRGSDVARLQEKLVSLKYSVGPCGIDGIFGPDTEKAVRAFQTDYVAELPKFGVDGIVGPETWGALTGAVQPGTIILKEGSTGSLVEELQSWLYSHGFNPLKDKVDGIFGPKTKAAVEAFQKASGCTVDGEVGNQTRGAMASWGGPVPSPPADIGQAVVDKARAMFLNPGVKYVWGGADPSGADCSGMIKWIADNLGIPNVDRLVDLWDREQINPDFCRPGDVVYRNNGGHVGIWTGQGTVIHMSSSRGRCAEDAVAYFSPQWGKRLW